MMTKQEISALMKSVGGIVREYVSAALVSVSTRLDELDARIKAIPAGEKGERGPSGESIVGETGPQGAKGDPGESIIGPRGADGERGLAGESIIGPTGPQGEKGLDGKDAAPIHPDTIALMVLNEVQKAVAAIPKAKDGRDGEPGRDALQIEILPMIDHAKSYPRGTFAKYAGGLMRSTRNTNPQGPIFGDWEIVVEGIASLNIIRGADLRSITIDYGMTSGQRATETLTLPVLIYRDIFKDGETYVKGDVVTWGGSAWHCQADTTKAKPGVSPEWRMMVKEGRAGTVGTNGKDGERGPEGPRGKDLTQVDFNGRKH